MEVIKTERLIIKPMEQTELLLLIDKCRTSAPELSCAYSEMLENCVAHPEQYLWYIPWKICTRERGEEVGDAGFKGLSPDGRTEIGYGINQGFEGNGYATEAVRGLCHWALAQAGIKRIEAETAPDNKASMNVLKKIGFYPTGEMGKEGPRFAYSK